MSKEHRKSRRELVNGRLISTIAPGHGTVAGYRDYYCRCHECTDAHGQHRKRERAERRSVEEIPPELHGREATYTDRGCRCVACSNARSTAKRRREASLYQQRRDARRLVAGRMVTTDPDARHGRAVTYTHWFCRCASCSAAHSRSRSVQQRRKAGAA